MAKSYDLGGSEVYGTAGYYQIRPIAYPPGSTIYSGASAGNDLGISAGSNPTLYSAPAMLSSITGGAGDYVNFNSYAIFRGPDGSALYTQGGLSVPVNQGPYNTPSGGNNGYFGSAFSFTMGTSATYRVGVAVDMVADGTYAPNYVSIYNSSAGSVYSGSLTRDGTPDMTVFEIDAVAGESFSTALWQLSGTQSAAAFGLITFDVSRYNLDITSGTQTNSSVLGGSPAALLKTGAGTTVLTGESTFTGATTISNGAVQLGGAGTLAGGSYGGAVSLATNTSSLAIATTANQTLSGAINGSGSLSKSTTGTLTLSGSNSYGGATTISGGRVITTSSNALGDASAAITVSGGAYLDVRTNMMRTGTVTFDGGYLATSAGAPASLSKTGGSFVLSNAAEIVAELGGSAGLTSGGAGTAVLWRSNSYTGATVVNGGTLKLDGSGALSAGTTLQVDSGATFSTTGTFLTSNNVTVAGLTGAGTVSGAAGTLTVSKASGLDLFSGTIAGGMGLTKTGAGSLAFSGSNSYSGVTTISSGVLIVANDNALGSTTSGTVVSNGGQLRLTNAVIGNEALSISGMAAGASAGALRAFGTNNIYQGKVTLTDDAKIFSGAGFSLVLDVASGNAIEAANFSVTFDGAGTNVVKDAISLGTGGIVKMGTGILGVEASNNYSGVTDIQGGRLKVSGNGRLGSGAITISNANNGALEFAVSGTNVVANNISGAGSLISSSGETRFTGAVTSTGGLTNSSSTVRIGNGGTTGSYSGNTVLSDAAAQLVFDRSDAYTHGGTVSGNGSVIQGGAGTTIITNANTYTGGTTIGAGTLQFGNGGSVAGNITNNATLALNRSDIWTLTNIVSGTGSLTKAGAGTSTLTGLNTYSGGTFLNGGWLVAGHTNAFGAGSITVGSGTTLNLTNYRVGNLIVNNGGTILSTGQLDDVVATNGTTDIGGNNSTVAEVGGSATVNVSGSGVSVATVSGGTLNINGSGAVVTNFSGGNIAVSNGLSVALRSGTSSGAISGAGGIAKQGADKLTLSGANTYSGTTTVEAGTLVVNGSINSATTVQSGATLGGSGTVASATIQSGGTIGPGNSPGTLTITNGLTWSGGGNYNWQIFNVSGTAGQTNTWDLINVTGGTWDISGLSSNNKFNINLWSLSGLPDTTGLAAGFNATQNYSWMILASGGLSGTFNTNLFNINTSAINGTGGFVGATGLFSLALDGNNDLFLNYAGAGAAVPEPGTWAAGGLLLALAAFARRRAKARAGRTA